MGTLMKCGCNTHAVRAGTDEPVCVIHVTTGGPEDPATQVEDSPPDLSQRQMRCGYRHGKDGRVCAGRTPRPSDPRAAFFQRKPDEEFDQFYDGCWGWD